MEVKYSDRNPKIDVYVDGAYAYSTNWHRTRRNAKMDHLAKHPQHVGVKVVAVLGDD